LFLGGEIKNEEKTEPTITMGRSALACIVKHEKCKLKNCAPEL